MSNSNFQPGVRIIYPNLLKELLRITALLSFTVLSPEFCWIWLLLQVHSVYSQSSYAGCWNFQIFTKNTLLSSGLPGIGHCFPLLMPFSDTLFLFLLLPCHSAYGILVPWPGTELGPAVKALSSVLTSGPPGNFHFCFNFLGDFWLRVTRNIENF